MKMKSCSNGHQGIIYVGANCPLCVALAEVVLFEERLAAVEQQIRDLEDESDDLDPASK